MQTFKYPPLKVEVYADGASEAAMLARMEEGFVKGFTTNPTLMAKAGIRDYEKFAKSILSKIQNHPISFEVFADDFESMAKQAFKISSWAKNVYVKIPIMNTQRESAIPLIGKLLRDKIKLNVTAIFTENQLTELREVTPEGAPVIVSVFGGRIADTGVDPEPLMKRAVSIFADRPDAKVLWASPREVLNIFQAERCGCHIITCTDDIIAKLKLHQKPLDQFSLETVQMFYNDAKSAGFSLEQ